MGSGEVPAEGDRQAIDAIAADWLIARDRGWTVAEQREFARWLQADPRHAQAWAEAQEAWSQLGRLDELPATVVRSPAPAFRRARGGWPLGAALAAVLALGFFLWFRSETPSPSAPGIVRVAPRELVLPDDTRVELNAESEVQPHYTATERRVKLVRGEAHFTVTRNPARPFLVDAGGVVIQAVGTAFNVKLEHEEVGVLVTEGRVRVVPLTPEAPAAPAAAEPAEQVDVTIPDLDVGQHVIVPLTPLHTPPPIILMSPVEVARSLAWQGVRLQFRDVSLREVAAEFNRHAIDAASPRLVVGDTAADVHVAGTFRADRVDVFVRFLEEGFGIAAERHDDGQIVLRAR